MVVGLSMPGMAAVLLGWLAITASATYLTRDEDGVGLKQGSVFGVFCLMWAFLVYMTDAVIRTY
jgi:hypothetical protein